MGMFDSINIVVECPNCFYLDEYEDQFKWSDKFLYNYELGDYINNCNENLVQQSLEFVCKHYGYKFNVYSIIKNGQIVSFETDVNIVENIDFNLIENIEKNYMKEHKYKCNCHDGVGQTKETESINLHPKNINDEIVALTHKWQIKKVYKKYFYLNDDEKNKYLLGFRFMLTPATCNYIYKVFNNDLGYGWPEVSNKFSMSIFDYVHGNMKLSKEMNLEEGYDIELIN